MLKEEVEALKEKNKELLLSSEKAKSQLLIIEEQHSHERHTRDRLEASYKDAIKDEEAKVSQLQSVLEVLRNDLIANDKEIQAHAARLQEANEKIEELEKENTNLKAKLSSSRLVMAGEGASGDDKRLAVLLDLQARFVFDDY